MNNQTVIDTVVKYSKECIVMRFIKNHLTKSFLLVKALPLVFRLPSADTIKIVIKELEIRIDEREQDVGKLLTPLFEGHDFGHKNSKKHSLTVQEIREGYIMLDGEKYVIFLRTIFHEGITYEAGVLYKIDGVIEKILKLLKPSKEEIITNEILNIVINKKSSYEYLN